MNNIGTLSVLNWIERIEVLVSSRQWEKALQLSLDFYSGKAEAAVGLPTELSKLQEIAGTKIADLLLRYLDVALQDSAKIQQSEQKIEYFKKVCHLDEAKQGQNRSPKQICPNNLF